MLTMKRHAVLPRMQNIYAAFLELLLDPKNSRQTRPARDTEPHPVDGPPEADRVLVLLNEYAEADRKEVLHQIGLELRNMPEIEDSPERVLRGLVGSNSVLRESVPGRIDFLHQTIAEYLAASAVIDQGAIESLIAHAHKTA